MWDMTFFIALSGFFFIEIIPALRRRRPSLPVILLPAAGILFFFNSQAAALLGGVVLIIISAEKLISGAGSLARRAGVAPLMVGIFIVGLGTSSPELFINLLSALRGDTDLALGNILGSNVANLGIILGLGGLIAGKMQIQRSLISTEGPILLGATLLLILLSLDFPPLAAEGTPVQLSRQDGAVLLWALMFYLLYLYGSVKRTPVPKAVVSQYTEEAVKLEEPRLSLSFARIAVGLPGLYLGGEFTVSGALGIAAALGAGTVALGIIVGVGTSLPELAATLTSAIRKETDLIIGNVVGSNIFNILLILGITAAIQPVSMPGDLAFHLVFLAGTTLLFFFSMGTRRCLSRGESLLLLLAGLTYLTLSLTRGAV